MTIISNFKPIILSEKNTIYPDVITRHPFVNSRYYFAYAFDWKWLETMQTQKNMLPNKLLHIKPSKQLHSKLSKENRKDDIHY